nr:NADH dehydrogenase subunit 6 [Nereididae sp. SIO BIC A9836]
MTLFMINSIIITLFISCLTATSPINLGISVLMIAVFIAISLAATTTSWFGFITFIIYVGGMLVMFAYFAALQPNQHIISWMQLLMPLTLTMIIMTMNSNLTLTWTSIAPSTSQIYSSANFILPILMALVLFLALVMVVKTSRADEGPLRPFN